MFKKLTTHSSHEASSEVIADEPDSPPILTVTAVVLGSFLLVFTAIALTFPAVQQLTNFQLDQADTGMGNSNRLNYLAQEQKILSTSQKIDDAHIQIPIEQAMKIVVEKQANVFGSKDSQD